MIKRLNIHKKSECGSWLYFYLFTIFIYLFSGLYYKIFGKRKRYTHHEIRIRTEYQSDKRDSSPGLFQEMVTTNF